MLTVASTSPFAMRLDLINVTLQREARCQRRVLYSRGQRCSLLSPRLTFVEIFNDASFHFQGVEWPLRLVENLAGRIDQDGEWQGAVPARLEGFDQFVLVVIAEDQVLIRGLLFL